MVPDDLLSVLCCPRCRGPLVPDAARSVLKCAACAVLYAVSGGIPVLIAPHPPAAEDERDA